jgi:hypothetical protein
MANYPEFNFDMLAETVGLKSHSTGLEVDELIATRSIL